MRKRELIQGCVSERGGVYRQSTGDVRSEKGRENQKGRQKNTLAETGGEDNKKRKEYTAPTDDTSSPSGLYTYKYIHVYIYIYTFTYTYTIHIYNM